MGNSRQWLLGEWAEESRLPEHSQSVQVVYVVFLFETGEYSRKIKFKNDTEKTQC